MTERSPSGAGVSPRWAQAVSGGLSLLLTVLLVYFRLGPFARVAARLRESGSPLPEWFSLVFTLGVGIVALLFAARGLRLLRGAFRT